jgi:hypothetical protein
LTSRCLTGNPNLSQGSASKGFPFSKPPLDFGNGFFLFTGGGFVTTLLGFFSKPLYAKNKNKNGKLKER